ncbi:hypothetical protein PMIN06_004015 [Paraphaeosphaeria minitans]
MHSPCQAPHTWLVTFQARKSRKGFTYSDTRRASLYALRSEYSTKSSQATITLPNHHEQHFTHTITPPSTPFKALLHILTPHAPPQNPPPASSLVQNLFPTPSPPTTHKDYMPTLRATPSPPTTCRYPMPTLKATPTPTPPIPLHHRWRCCRPSCTHPNTTTTPVHFAPYFSPAENALVKAPGHYGQKCASCAHPACDACCFLEASRVDGSGAASAEGERSPWVEIGYWDRREDFETGEVVGLRRSDELPPASRRGLGEAWRRNGRWDA